MKLVYQAYIQVPVLGSGQGAIKKVEKFLMEGKESLDNEFNSIEEAFFLIEGFYNNQFDTIVNDLIILPVIKG